MVRFGTVVARSAFAFLCDSEAADATPTAHPVKVVELSFREGALDKALFIFVKRSGPHSVGVLPVDIANWSSRESRLPLANTVSQEGVPFGVVKRVEIAFCFLLEAPGLLLCRESPRGRYVAHG